MIAYPEAKRIERWDLGTMTRDGDPADVPFEGTLEAIAMGADSEGPLLATWWYPHENTAVKDVKNNRLSFLDLTRFKVLAVSLIALPGTMNTAARLAASGGDFQFAQRASMGQTRIRSSYDGSLFAICRSDDVQVTSDFALKADAGAVSLCHDVIANTLSGTPVFVPSPDGRRIFRGKTGFRDEPLLRFPSTDPRLDISLRGRHDHAR